MTLIVIPSSRHPVTNNELLHVKRCYLYKLLLCWRYLLTRYLALVCIISVMLGVATLIVVNSVMAGFSTKLRDRLHGLLSDVVVAADSFTGMDGYGDLMETIRHDAYLS